MSATRATPAPGTRRARSLGAGGQASPPRLALRKSEAAAALGLSDESFDKYVRPSLRAVRVGSTRLYPVAELQRWLAEHAEAPLEELARTLAGDSPSGGQ